MFKWLKYLPLLALALLAVPQPTFALGDPDILGLLTYNSYSDLAVSGDRLYLIQYQIEYAILPTESITEGWLIRLVDAEGAGQLCSVAPHAGDGIPDLGYSRGVASCYFVQAPTITGTLRLHISGNPGLSPTPAGTYTSSLTEKSGSELATDLRAIAQSLESLWDIDLVAPSSDGQIRFTDSGEGYFESAMPNLRRVAPDLFTLQTIRPDFPDREVDTAYADSRAAIWEGTAVQEALDMADTSFGGQLELAKLAIASVLACVVALGVVRMMPDTAFTSTLAIWAAFLVIAGGFVLGWVPLPVLAVLSIAPMLAVAKVMFLDRAS